VTPFFLANIRWPPWEASICTEPIRAITSGVCTYFYDHPDRAQRALDTIDQGLQKTNETRRIFVQTIAYLSLAPNRDKLSMGGDNCAAFFNEIKDKLVADWKNQNSNTATAQQKALETLKDFHNTLKSLMARP
jgi:hypothetical protein